MKQFIFTIIFLPIVHLAFAQAPPPPDSVNIWKRTGLFQVNLSQTSLTNWQGGGESSFALGALLDYKANYIGDVIIWDNSLEIGYGTIRQGGNRWLKTDDRVLFLSKFSRRLTEVINATVIADFRTQLAPGYEYYTDSAQVEQRELISDFMSPAYLQLGIGAEYRPNDVFFIFVSPLTSKFTFVMNDRLADSAAYGVEPGKNVRVELGASLISGYAKEIMTNVFFETNLNLFANYQTITAIDVNWENLLRMKINRYLSANISTQLIYDEDIQINREDGTKGPAIQFKQVLNVGLSIDF